MTHPSANALLERYETMLTLSRHMLDAARKGEWDHLVSLVEERTAIADALQQSDQATWQGAQATRKAHLIAGILDADVEVKSLTEAWMKELHGMLGSISTEKKIKKAYE